MKQAAPGQLWTKHQVRTVAIADLLAVLVVVIAVLGARGEASMREQIAWVNVAVMGLLLVVLAHGALFLVGRRAIGQRRLRVLPDVAVSVVARSATSDPGWWWIEGTARAHLVGCQMINGKRPVQVTPDQIRERRLVRCEVCR